MLPVDLFLKTGTDPSDIPAVYPFFSFIFWRKFYEIYYCREKESGKASAIIPTGQLDFDLKAQTPIGQEAMLDVIGTHGRDITADIAAAFVPRPTQNYREKRMLYLVRVVVVFPVEISQKGFETPTCR